MKSFGAVLALSGAASAAAILPRQSSDSHCCFDINVAGSVAGPLGQLADGQNRVGPGFTSTQFCYYNGTTSIVDSTGRGCIATAPTSQYQCDAGLTASTATPGITIANNGSIEHNGSAVWYECNSGSGYNIYANSPGSAATGCSQVMLNIANGNCSVPVASSSVPASSASKASSSVPASSASVPASSPSAPASSPSAPVSSATTVKVTQTTAATTTVSQKPSTASTTLVSTVSQSPSTASVTIVSTAPASSCVPTTVTAPAPPAATVTAPAPPAVTVTAPAPPAVTVTAPAPPAVTVTAPATSCVPNTVTVTVTAPGTPSAPAAATTSAPAAPPATTYACNPAHSYPGGVSCVSSGTGLTLVTPTAAPPTPSAPGAGTTSAPVAPPATTYACNPAHSYPGGVSCVSSGTGLTLVTPSATAPVSSAPAPSAPAPSAPASSAPAPSAPASSAPVSAPASSVASSVAKPSPSAPAGACAPGIENQVYEYPHLIVPVSSAHPDTAYGTQYFAGVNSTFSTIFNFDIPASYQGKTCTLEFLLPNAKDLVTSSYTMSGTGAIDFKQLASPATQVTTFANQPAVAKDLGQFTVTSGSSTIVASGPCAAGTTVSYELTAEGNTELYYFQDWNPSAIGLYIVEC